MDSPIEPLVELASSLVDRLRRRGADTVEVSASSGWELTTKVRLGEVELVEEAGHKHVSVRVIRDARVAVTATSDFTDPGICRCINDAMELLDLSESDPDAAPAPPELLAKPPFVDLDLYDPEVESLDAKRGVEFASRAEQAAFSADHRITLSEGATFSRASGQSAMVLSSGFVGTRRGTQVSLGVSPVVEDEEQKRRRGHYYTLARHLSALETAEAVGMEAARRTTRQLGARPIRTCEAPIIFSPEAARAIIGEFIGCAMGGAIWRRSSYLCGREGSSVASPVVTLVDDPFIQRGLGSRAFDGEGLPCRTNTVIDGGTYVGPLLDCLSARKLNRTSTSSAVRYGGSLAASTSNLVMRPGTISEDELVSCTERGLYVTDMMGFGFNPVTGDFSRGASGFWIEGGEFLHPVSEVTISSNLDRMLKAIDLVALHGKINSSMVVPPFRIAQMTIAGS